MKKCLTLLTVFVLTASICACGTKKASEPPVPSETITESISETLTEASESETEAAIVYTPCTVDEIVNDIATDLDNAKTKYANQYLEISGILDSCLIDENSTPKGKSVYLKVDQDATASSENKVWSVAAMTWSEDDYPMVDFEKAMAELQPGDPVIVKVYADDNMYMQSLYAASFTLLGVEKQ